MKAARQVLARFASKIVPSVKSPASPVAKSAAPSQLNTEQLREVVGAGPKGNW